MTTTISNPEVRSTDLLVHELLVQLRAAERAEERADAIKAELVERLGDGGKVETHEAKIGSLELSMKDKETVNIPVWAGVGAIAVGGVLLLMPKKS